MDNFILIGFGFNFICVILFVILIIDIVDIFIFDDVYVLIVK